MISLPPPSVLVLDAIALAVVVWLLDRIWRHRTDPHATPLLVVVTLLGLATVVHPLSIAGDDMATTLGIAPFRFRGAVQVSVVAFTVVAWFVFALRQIGRAHV